MFLLWNWVCLEWTAWVLELSLWLALEAVVRVEGEGWAYGLGPRPLVTFGPLSSRHSPPRCEQMLLQRSGWQAEALENWQIHTEILTKIWMNVLQQFKCCQSSKIFSNKLWYFIMSLVLSSTDYTIELFGPSKFNKAINISVLKLFL